MRPPTKGRVLKERVWCFVEALLTRAEDSSDFEVHWEDEDTDRPKLVVKTRRRFLEVLTQLKQSHIYEVINSLKGLELLEDRRFKQKRGSDQWCFALKLWSRDAQRNREHFERVWEGSRTDKSKALEATYKKSAVSAEAPQDEIDWRDVCRSRLEKQKQLTTNRLMHPKEMVFDINQIHVPLALVERKQPDKRSGDDNPEQSQSYKPDYEETQKLEYIEFLATVLKSEQSKKVAIIGEPGAGKTTLLQRIAFWILDNTDDLPIWIPLGNFPNSAPKFKDYLLNDWLEDAILSVTPKIKAEFEGLLIAGRVWLLLDGVDEMVANSWNPLSFIDNWIPGWCQQLSVVLTCRLNVWEANPHALNNFQTYRTLEFSQEKVNKFIEDCFQNRRGAQLCASTLGEQLQQALNQPGKERIKDLIRNPLRLTLLCSTWHLREGKLPDTKAELYQQFVEEVYRWKEDEFPTTAEERKQFNAKLKELALAAIDKEENRCCLRHKFVEGILGDRNGSVFQLALNIGWLNRVGLDAKNPNPNQPVYAFFHPTFQEYFAALAIADWDFFLPRAHNNHNPKPVSERYRIFEPQWKEVILLWLGRKEVAKEQKEEFIKALESFNDGCAGFYWFRAYFLVAVGIAEFRNCSLPDEIVEQLVKWGFGYFNAEDQSWVTFLEPIAQGARAALHESDRERAITFLIELLQTAKDKFIRRAVVNSLGEIGAGDEAAIQMLMQLIQADKDSHWLAAHSLGKIGVSSETAIQSVVQLIQTTDDGYTRGQAAESLWRIDPGNPTAIATLVQLILMDHEDLARDATYRLVEIDPGNQTASAALVKLIETTEDEYIRWVATDNLREIDPSNSIVMAGLVKFIETTECEFIRREAATSLGKIDPGNEMAIATLVQLIETSKDNHAPRVAAYNLGEVGAAGNQKAIRTLVKLIKNTKSEHTRGLATASLAAIGAGNEIAIQAIEQLIQTTEDESTCRRAAQNLLQIDPDNQVALRALLDLMQTAKNEIPRWMAAETLREIDPGNQAVIAALIDMLLTFKEERRVAWSLEQVDDSNLLKYVIISLKGYLADQVREKDFKRFQLCYYVLWHCGQNMTYPTFYQVWHQQEGVEKTTTPNSQSLNQANLPQSLQTGITKDPQLSQTIHLICIDGSQFIERDRPAAEIYDQMLDQNCPECDSVPETMPALKLYWNSLKRKSDKRLVLVFYASSTDAMSAKDTALPCPYSETFLSDLSKFGREICVITEQPFDRIPLKFFAPSQAIENLLEWIRQKVIEE